MAQQQSGKKKEELDMYIVEKVKAKRLALGWSQAVIATKLDISNGFFAQIENPNHRAKFNIAHLMKLSEIFDCSPCDFLPKKSS